MISYLCFIVLLVCLKKIDADVDIERDAKLTTVNYFKLFSLSIHQFISYVASNILKIEFFVSFGIAGNYWCVWISKRNAPCQNRRWLYISGASYSSARKTASSIDAWYA